MCTDTPGCIRKDENEQTTKKEVNQPQQARILVYPDFDLQDMR